MGYRSRLTIVSLATVFGALTAPTPHADAEVVGRGTLTATVNAPTLPYFTATGLIEFENQDFAVFGDTINLAAIDLAFDLGGTFLYSGPPAGGTFAGTFAATTGALNFDGTGEFICPSAENCNFGIVGDVAGSFIAFVDPSTLSGIFVDGGPGTLPTFIPGVGEIRYSIDGPNRCDTGFATVDCDGAAALNAFIAHPTLTGTDVQLASDTVFNDPTDGEEQPVSLGVKFDQVTSDGETVIVTQSQSLGVLPSNFRLGAAGAAPFYFDISTTAAFLGDIIVCSSFSDYDDVLECANHILHDDVGSGTGFVDATMTADDPDCPLAATCDSCIDTTTNQVCSRVTSLSPFVVAVDVTSDAEAPQVTDADVIPSSVNIAQAPGNANCTIGATDLLAGVSEARCTLQSPKGVQTASCVATAPNQGNDLDGSWTCTATIPQGSRIGLWTLVEVTAMDANGNVVVLTGSDLLFDGSPLPPSITVTNTTNDCSAARMSPRDTGQLVLWVLLCGIGLGWWRRRVRVR